MVACRRDVTRNRRSAGQVGALRCCTALLCGAIFRRAAVMRQDDVIDALPLPMLPPIAMRFFDCFKY